MTNEELNLKLGVDVTAWDQGVTKAKAEVKGLGEHINKTFASKPGEGLKDVFKSLTDQCPLLGTAIKAAFNPVAGTLTAATAAFLYFKTAINEWTADLDKQGERMAKPWVKSKENLRDARLEAQKNKQERSYWEHDLHEGKPGEQEDIQLRRSVAAARVDSGGDEVKFLKDKIDIQKQAKVIADEQQKSADAEQANLSAAREDPARLKAQKDRKDSMDSALKDQERINAEIVAQEEKIKALKLQQEKPWMAVGIEAVKGENTNVAKSLIGLGSSALSAIPVLGNVEKAAATAAMAKEMEHEQGKLERLQDEKKRLRLTERSAAAGIEKDALFNQDNAHNIQEAQALADKAKQRSLSIEMAIAEDRAKLFAEERKRRDDDLKDAIAKAEKKAGADKVAFLAEKIMLEERALNVAQNTGEVGDQEQARIISRQIGVDKEEEAKERFLKDEKQKKFDRDIKFQRDKERERVMEPYLRTYDEIGKSKPWSPFGNVNQFSDRMQAQMDQMAYSTGTAYEQNYSEDAEEIGRLEKDAAMAARVEGPDSRRFLEDTEKIKALKERVDKSGLTHKDTSLEKIQKSMEDLVVAAKIDGLVIKPRNAP